MPPAPPDQRSPFPTSRKPPPAAASPATQDDHDDGDDHDGGDGDEDDPPGSRRRASHRRQDRGDGDDDAAHRALPVFVRYAELVASGIVGSWTQLLRLIDTQDFPVGVMIGPNTRAWRLDEIEQWLASRPTARKVLPPRAAPHRRKRADTDAAEAR